MLRARRGVESANRSARAAGPWWACPLAVVLAASDAAAQGQRLISQDGYVDRLRAMWLAECSANWTGLKTEGKFVEPPFLTDTDWGMNLNGFPLTWVYWQNPWLSDDDTDIEYVYLHLIHQAGHNLLTPEEIAAGWQTHINRFIWVSNDAARALMGRGVLPPATGLAAANEHWLMIDAQLTTEFFGALCPGMPEEALRLAELPVRTTSAGYATHAAQFFVVLYAEASQVDPALSGRDKVLWLFGRARRWIPDASKTADIADFVLADFLANPDPDDWESTRDKVYERYQLHASDHGFVYRAWYESSVNFAGGLIALLYGQGDFKRTVQIGTLTGWDSDNGTATMGGLVGLMNGYDAIQASFPGFTMAETYDSYTRDNMPDYLPGDPKAEDAFALMAQRAVPMVERAVLGRGGLVKGGQWLLPPALGDDVIAANPAQQVYARSANNLVPLLGGIVVASSSVPSAPPWGYGSPDSALIANGFEHDFSGAEPDDAGRAFYSSQGGAAPEVVLSVSYSMPVPVHTVRLIEGDHFDERSARGGWFESPIVEVRIGGRWLPPPDGAELATPPDSARPFQILDFVLKAPVVADGVRVRGAGGGADQFVTCAELDALSAPITVQGPAFDLNGDSVINPADIQAWKAAPIDLDGDGSADTKDLEYLAVAVEWSAMPQIPNESAASHVPAGSVQKAPWK